MAKSFDVIVIGAGHAGCEAAFAAARLGAHVAICTLSPERIILGGGVMRREHLLPAIRRQVRERLNGYVQDAAIIERIDDYIVPPLLGHRAGVAGAMALAGAGQNG